MRLFYNLANAAMRIAARILLDMHITGLENMPKSGPIIVAMNHTSFLDPVLIGMFIPRYVTMMSKAENFSNPLFAIIIRLYGVFPVRRGEIDREALLRSVKALQAGDALLMAPEGTRSKTGLLQKGRDGTAFVALRAGAPILPVAIWGGKQFWSNLKRLRRTRIDMVIGEPFRLVSSGEPLSRYEMRQMTTEAMCRLAALLPTELRGPYSNLSAATGRYVAPVEHRRTGS
jgi:1-acyl-sn-glycerol-3-phosphate acyltransferase